MAARAPGRLLFPSSSGWLARVAGIGGRAGLSGTSLNDLADLTDVDQLHRLPGSSTHGVVFNSIERQMDTLLISRRSPLYGGARLLQTGPQPLSRLIANMSTGVGYVIGTS